MTQSTFEADLDAHARRLDDEGFWKRPGLLMDTLASRVLFQHSAQRTKTGRSIKRGNVRVEVQYDKRTLDEGPIMVSVSSNPADAEAPVYTAAISDDIRIRQPNTDHKDEFVIAADRRHELMIGFIDKLHGIIETAAMSQSTPAAVTVTRTSDFMAS